MKTLLVLRHGKSDWQAEYGVDHDRPLAKRGIKAAASMGRFLELTGQRPQLVLTSTATRAAETVRLAAGAGRWDCPVQSTRRLYEAASDGVLDILQGQDDRRDLILTAGHEPTCSELVSRLVGGAEVRFPTAAMARVDFAVGRWTEISFGHGQLIWLVTPKLLRGLDL